MRQAIEEGFILDVLRNYTPYKLAFRLAALGPGGDREFSEQDVVRDEALKGVLRWVRLHPYNIAQKVQVVVEHFRETVAPLLEGKSKAMVVVGSRVEAVRWQRATTKYIRDQGYRIGALVAFSGEVSDPESGPDPFTERSLTLNPALRGRDLREAFATDEYHLLLVANKFQTGFDQPLLCGMYVDKRLAGVQAVQTLSRAVNDLFEGALTDDDKLVYVNNILKGKLLESQTLVQQARNNSKEQFATSPDLGSALMNAIMDAFAAHGTISKQALDSERVRRSRQDILLGPGQLWEALRGVAGLSLSNPTGDATANTEC